MKFSRLLYVVCLILSGLSFSVYADEAWQQQQPGQAQSPGSNRPGGRPDSNEHGQQNPIQPTQVEDEGGSLKMAPTNEKNTHSYRPQSGDNESQQNDEGKSAENNSPVINTTSIDANKFDSV